MSVMKSKCKCGKKVEVDATKSSITHEEPHCEWFQVFTAEVQRVKSVVAAKR